MSTNRAWTDPQTIAAGGSAGYEVRFAEHHAGWNRAVIMLQAVRP